MKITKPTAPTAPEVRSFCLDMNRAEEHISKASTVYRGYDMPVHCRALAAQCKRLREVMQSLAQKEEKL